MLDPRKEEPGGTGLGLDRSQSSSLEAPTRNTMLLANSGSPRLADGSVENARCRRSRRTLCLRRPHTRTRRGEWERLV